MKTFRRRGLLALTTLAAGVLVAPIAVRSQTTVTTLADTLAGDPRFARFLDMISRASAVEDFRQASTVTVFAPTDEAFLNSPAGVLQQLIGLGGSGESGRSIDRVRVLALIRNHMVQGVIQPGQFDGPETRLRTLGGGDIAFATPLGVLSVWNPEPGTQSNSFSAAGLQTAPPAEVGTPGIVASNGMIYPISQILWP